MEHRLVRKYKDSIISIQGILEKGEFDLGDPELYHCYDSSLELRIEPAANGTVNLHFSFLEEEHPGLNFLKVGSKIVELEDCFEHKVGVVQNATPMNAISIINKLSEDP